MTSPEKSVAQEAEALLEKIKEQRTRIEITAKWKPGPSERKLLVSLLRDAETVLAEQHRLEAENRSLREALREIGQEAMLAASDPHLSAADYRKALREVCNLALAQEDSRHV